MSTVDPQLDPALDTFLSEAVEAVEQELSADSGYPDFAAVVSLARELDPSRVSAEQVAEVSDYAPVVPLAGQRRRRSTGNDLAMAAFVAEVRASVDVDVAEAFAARAAGGTSGAAVPLATPAANERATPRLWATVLAVAAALVVVGGGVVSAVGLTEDAVENRSEAALHGEGDAAGDGAVEHHEEAVRPAPNASPLVPEPTPRAPEPTPLAEDDGSAQPASVVSAKAPSGRRPGRRPAPRKSLAELDAAARQAWRAGDRDEAKRLFKLVVARGGTGQLAQMAYGDLMALARQQGARGTEASLWRAYLRRFPKGVFAEDARAGLCRRTSDDKSTTCWQQYLDDFPKGSHAKAARRVLTTASKASE